MLVNAVIVAMPVLLKPGWSHSWYRAGAYKLNLLGVWGALVVARWIWQTATAGRRKAAWNTYWSARAVNFAGNINETAEYILTKKHKGGRQISPQRIYAGILQQIADLVKQLTDTAEDTNIQACLLTPEHDNATNQVVALNTITYNKLTADRRHSRIPMESPGAVTVAFRENRASVVPDTRTEEYREAFKGRPYRSVMAFPINIGEGAGQRVAVVSVDASTPEVFTTDVLEEFGIEDAISPFLKLLGLLLIADRPRK